MVFVMTIFTREHAIQDCTNKFWLLLSIVSTEDGSGAVICPVMDGGKKEESTVKESKKGQEGGSVHN